MLPFGSKSSGGSSGPFAGIEQAMKSGGPMSVMRSFYNIPAPGMPQQAAPQPQNPMSREQLYAQLMQHPAFANFMQQHRPQFMANMAGAAPPQPPQMPPAMPQQAAPQSMAGMAQPGLMQMLAKLRGQPRVQGLLG